MVILYVILDAISYAILSVKIVKSLIIKKSKAMQKLHLSLTFSCNYSFKKVLLRPSSEAVGYNSHTASLSTVTQFP